MRTHYWKKEDQYSNLYAQYKCPRHTIPQLITGKIKDINLLVYSIYFNLIIVVIALYSKRKKESICLKHTECTIPNL